MSVMRLFGWAGLAAIGPLVAWLTPSLLTQSLVAQATFLAIFALGVGLLLRQNGTVSLATPRSSAYPATCWAPCSR